jgi:hypothetical protein
MRRMIALIMISACVATGAAACAGASRGGQSGRQTSTTHSGGSAQGGSGQVGTGQGGTAQSMTVLRELARCIRSHGMPGWPDPEINPLTNTPDFPPDAPHVPASIQQACQSIASRLPPDAQATQPPTVVGMQGLLRFARCVRSRGVPNWPDPNALGEFPIDGHLAAQFKGSANRSAINACIRYVPGGNQYLRFVAASAPQPATGGGNG